MAHNITGKSDSPASHATVRARLDQFKSLEAGWLDGQGVPVSDSGLDWLADAIDRHYPDDVPPPRLYPTPEGGISAEWSPGQWEVSLEVDLEAQAGNLHALNVETGEDFVDDLDLSEHGDWLRLALLVAGMASGPRRTGVKLDIKP